MLPSDVATRRLLALCGLLSLAEMTQDEVDDLFRRRVEEADPDNLAETPAPAVNSAADHFV